MDPRSFTVKPCPGAYAQKSFADINNAISTRRDFFNNIGKLGSIQAINETTGFLSNISNGLKTLSTISNTIRTGCGTPPSIIGDTLDNGANWVLEHMGIAPAVINTLQDFHPETANQAYSQAQLIFQHIQQGNFKFSDVPNYLQDFQNLEILSKSIFTSGDDRFNSLTPRCGASPYAVDLIARAPKFKFMFIVEFSPASGYEFLDPILRGLAFVVKKASRPKITFQAEDLNLYNHRTKLITKTVFDEMSMSFHDDILNNTTQFYVNYMQAMSPTTNINPEQAYDHSALESQGMNFYTSSNNYSASLGIQRNNNKQSIFKEIILYHVFNSGLQVTAYHFINPKIIQLIPDDVQMDVSNDGNELQIVFVYDSVFVETNPITTYNDKFIAAQSNAFYQLKNNDNFSSQQGPNQTGLSPYSIPNSGSNCNPLNTSSSLPDLAIGGGFGGAFGQSLFNHILG